MSVIPGEDQEPTLSFEEAYQGYSTEIDFMGVDTVVTSVPLNGPRLDITPYLKDPADFHGDPRVHDVVQFGRAMQPLIGEYTDPNGFFADRKNLPERGVIILADHYDDAKVVVNSINSLANQVIANPGLYDDPEFCADYYEFTKMGYELLAKRLPEFTKGDLKGIPVSLERAGLVATRLAWGVDKNARLADEIPVVTKRAHPINGTNADLMVTVRWRASEHLTLMDGEVLDIADFVSPASGASVFGLLVAASNRGIHPHTVISRSIMGTEQGIEFAFQALHSSALGGIEPIFYTVGVSKNLSPDYYLYNPAVADAGHMLRHSLPSWYQA